MFLPIKASTLVFFIVLCFQLSGIAQQPADVLITDRARAMALVDSNRYLDAYPILEKIAKSLPKDVDVWTHYGIAIATRSATLDDPKIRKSERKRAYEVLQKAKELGTDNVMALHFLDQLPPDGGEEDNFKSENPEVEKALREGEQHFGKGEYEKAFAAYEKAFKLDPKNYEAVLFMGDSIYAQRKYAQSEPWFAKAVAIEPDRELAYRFWGDALLYQGKLSEATAKFIDAFVAEPYSRYAWENVNKLTEKYNKQFNVRGIFPPGTENFGGINIDTAKLSDQDGTKLWLRYTVTRETWKRESFKKEYPGMPYRHSLKEEVAALRSVADLASNAVKSGQLKTPHHSLENLILFQEKGMLEPYVLFLMPNEGIAEDFVAYRKSNRDKLRKFLVEHVFVF